MKTYSIKFTDDEYDETQWQNEAVNLFKTEHKSIIVNSKLISDWTSDSKLISDWNSNLYWISD